ncbi:MAG: thiamine-monophosphate kinase [Phycisphaerae bacterium]|jgi:thiamine-monophosphate kinase
MNTGRAGQAGRRGERELLARLRRELARQTIQPAAAVPFGDDMAALDPADPRLLWTTDMLMDGVDFRSAEHGWFDVGWKCMAVNLSDCAAMAARPVGALCAVALSNALTMDDALRLLQGLRECGEQYGCPLVGGDTNSWDQPTVIAVTVAGRIDPGTPPVLRSGARPGDWVYVTGPVGGSILGRHLHPCPRVREALEISRTLAPAAMIDISDGLAIDLSRVCEESGCGADLDATRLDAAVHEDAHRLASQTGRTAREHALEDGEDFELIVVLRAPPPDADRKRFGLLPLGRMVAEAGLFLRVADGSRAPLIPRGWEHFC